MSRTYGILALISALLLAAPGCGVEEEERTDLELVGGKADIPSWLKHIPVNWACDQTLTGKFKGSDSAHLYSFAGKIGYEYTFTFKATYPSYKGAVVAVYDSETGDRVAIRRNWGKNDAWVTYKAEKSIKYLVAVYSIYVYATGDYTLAAGCKVIAVTCQSDAACQKGDFCKFDSGCGKGGLGVCTTISQFCTKQYMPVCGCDGKTYGNSCEAAAAGVSIASNGACAPVTPAVKVTLDKPGYMVGEAVTATITNAGKESIFLGGCSVSAWQKQVNGAWVDQGPDKVCVWEGIGKEVAAGLSYDDQNGGKTEGTWRLAVGYSIGCTPGKPLSGAACKASYVAYSPAFPIKDCPMLAMPNPNSFCPTGKIVPKYDAQGICIAGYGCVPCQPVDCGPALGMPNTLCPDGKTMSGPTGKCLGNGWGSCAWEVLSCPAPPACKASGCSGQVCSDQDVITTCEWLPWYACYQQSECGAFGANGACAWKQTAAFTSCMAQYGK